MPRRKAMNSSTYAGVVPGISSRRLHLRRARRPSRRTRQSPDAVNLISRAAAEEHVLAHLQDRPARVVLHLEAQRHDLPRAASPWWICPADDVDRQELAVDLEASSSISTGAATSVVLQRRQARWSRRTSALRNPLRPGRRRSASPASAPPRRAHRAPVRIVDIALNSGSSILSTPSASA